MSKDKKKKNSGKKKNLGGYKAPNTPLKHAVNMTQVYSKRSFG